MSELYAYYEKYDESKRLTRDRLHYSEYLVTLHLLKKYLGGGPLKVLDCCAGCGAYSTVLAQMGHLVTAGDLIPAHVAYMQEHCTGLKEIYQGSACDLSRFEDASFDVVLNFGALYHLQEASERGKTVEECLRVLRPGGIFGYTYQTLEAMLMGQYWKAVQAVDPDLRRQLYGDLEQCRLTHKRGVFYGMTPDEHSALQTKHHLKQVANACTYPVFYPFFREIESLSEEEYAQYVKTCILVCEEEAVVRNAMHGLCFTKKLG